MKKRGHEVLITVSDKDIARQLLDLYHLPYITLGSYGKGIFRKIINLPILDFRMWKAVHKYNPDVLIGFGSIRAAHTGLVLRKKSIVLDDTEHAKFGQMLYKPFASYILTPTIFQKDFGNKQLRFDGTTDLMYLHPNRFTPNPEILHEIGLSPDDTFFIVRFISWDANHDIGVKGIGDKISFVKELEKHGRVLITSEGELPAELEHLKIKISPEKIHHVMAYAALFIGESGTMATESAALGVHAVLMDPESIQKDGSFTFGVMKLFHNHGLLDVYNNETDVLNRAAELLKNSDIRKEGKEKQKKLLAQVDDCTDFLIQFVERHC